MTNFEESIMTLLVEQDLYKTGESDGFSNKLYEWKVIRTENGWVLLERCKAIKKSDFKRVNQDENISLSQLLRKYVFYCHNISY